MDSLLSSMPVQLTLTQVVMNLLIALGVGVAVAYVYKRTHKGVSYSQSFVIALVLVTIITATVIMVIGNSLTRAFGLIGAFAVIRFRTAVKDARDIAFLFFALVEGMACGTGAYQIAVVAYLVFSAAVFGLGKSNFGRYSSFEYLLSFHSRTKPRGKAAYLDLLEKYLDDHFLLSLRSTTRPSEVLISYNVRFKDNGQVKEFMRELKKAGASDIELISSQSDIDY